MTKPPVAGASPSPPSSEGERSREEQEPSLISLKRERDEAIRERDELRAAKWDVKHVDTMNDFAALGIDRDDWKARAQAAEQALAAIRNEVLEKVGPFARVLDGFTGFPNWQEIELVWPGTATLTSIRWQHFRALSTLYEKVKGEFLPEPAIDAMPSATTPDTEPSAAGGDPCSSRSQPCADACGTGTDAEPSAS